jgi:hypothetical protein
MEPVGLLSPVIDGRVTHFYEWRAAGYFAASSPGESMYRSEAFVSGIYYGFDLERLYLRIDPILGNHNPPEGLQFAVHFLTAPEWQIAFPVRFAEGAQQAFTLCSRGPGHARRPRNFTSIRSDRIVELSIPFAELRLHPKEKVNFCIRVEKGDQEVERYPRSGFLTVVVPDRDFENNFWQV